MTNDILDTRIPLNLTPTEVYEFLIKLSSDDAFRTRLEQNPTEVLAEHHIHVPIDQLPGIVVLPSKESLQRALDKFSNRGEIDLEELFSPSGWPLMLFWWLYMTPAKPPRGKEGEKVHVQSK